MSNGSRFRGGSAENFTELVELYLKQTTDNFGKIRLGLEEGDAAERCALSHSCAAPAPPAG